GEACERLSGDPPPERAQRASETVTAKWLLYEAIGKRRGDERQHEREHSLCPRHPALGSVATHPGQHQNQNWPVPEIYAVGAISDPAQRCSIHPPAEPGARPDSSED